MLQHPFLDPGPDNEEPGRSEFDLRVDQALASRTYAELTAVTADIPAAATLALPLREPASTPAKPQMNTGSGRASA